MNRANGSSEFAVESIMRFEVNPALIMRFLLTIILLLMSINIGQLIMRYSFRPRTAIGNRAHVRFLERAKCAEPLFLHDISLLTLLLYLNGLSERRLGGGGFAFHWYCLAVIFVFLASDEMLCFHEQLSAPFRRMLGSSGIFYLAWVIPYGLATFFVGAAFLVFLVKLPRETRRDFIVAGLLYIGGAIGMEMIGSVEYEKVLDRTLLMDIYVFVEESLEMFGVLLFIRALINHLGNRQVQLNFTESRGGRKTKTEKFHRLGE